MAKKPAAKKPAVPARIRVVIARPGETPEAIEIDNTLEAKSALVGGILEVLPMPHYGDGKIYGLMDEEGLLKGLPHNRTMRYGDAAVKIVGTIVFSKGREGASLTPYEAGRLIAYLNA